MCDVLNRIPAVLKIVPIANLMLAFFLCSQAQAKTFNEWLRQREFPSGFVISECSSLLEKETLFTTTLPEFKNLAIADKVKTLHEIAHKAWKFRDMGPHDAFTLEEGRGLGARLRFFYLSSTSRELTPYIPEIAVIAAKVGVYSPSDGVTAADYRQFLRRTIELMNTPGYGTPTEDNDARARLSGLFTFVLSRELVRNPSIEVLTQATDALEQTLNFDSKGFFQQVGLESSLALLMATMQAWPHLPPPMRMKVRPGVLELFRIPEPMLNHILSEQGRPLNSQRFQTISRLIRHILRSPGIQRFPEQALELEIYLPSLQLRGSEIPPRQLH